MQIRKVLITGAAGYLAGFVIERLRPHYELMLTDRIEPRPGSADLQVGVSPASPAPGTRPADGSAPQLRFIPGDITEYADVERACTGQDAVVHLVALVRERFDKPPWLFADVMVKGTWNVAEACVKQGVQRLVNISSIVASGSPLNRDRPYQVGDPAEFRAGDLSYCLAKHLGEQIGNAYHQAHGLSVIHLRPGVIARDGRNAEPVPPAEPGAPWFMHVDPRDVAQAVERALASEIVHGCYQIVAGRQDGLYDWTGGADELGYRPVHNWPEITG
jgi:uronate dehydrogenase